MTCVLAHVIAAQSSWAYRKDMSWASREEDVSVSDVQNSERQAHPKEHAAEGAYSRQPRDHTSTLSSMVHCEGTSNSSGALYGAVQCACSADSLSQRMDTSSAEDMQLGHERTATPSLC